MNFKFFHVFGREITSLGKKRKRQNVGSKLVNMGRIGHDLLMLKDVHSIPI